MQFNTIFISSYTFFLNSNRTNHAGPVNPLLNYFRNRAKRIYLLEQPLPGSDLIDTQLTLINEGIEGEPISKNFFFSNIDPKRLDTTRTYFRLKLRDVLSNIYFFLKFFRKLKKEKIDLYFGVECVNACFGVFLKKLGFAKKTIYYIFDWAPDRYTNVIMNRIYLWLDKIATYYSDYTWNITYTIADARQNILRYSKKRMSPQIYVPYCVNFDEGVILPEPQIDSNLLVYSGGLIKENGPQLLLEAFGLVIEKNPVIKLMIIGGGGMEQELRDYVVKHNMQKNVEFTGYIADETEILRRQSKAIIGVAPYPSIKGSRKPYGDVIKIRMYFSSGLVVVSTPVPPVSQEIEDEKLGIRTEDDSPAEIAKSLLFLLENKALLFGYRKNVIKKAKLSNWENNYTNALQQMKIHNS